jgi:hypothetical protein
MLDFERAEQLGYQMSRYTKTQIRSHYFHLFATLFNIYTLIMFTNKETYTWSYLQKYAMIGTLTIWMLYKTRFITMRVSTINFIQMVAMLLISYSKYKKQSLLPYADQVLLLALTFLLNACVVTFMFEKILLFGCQLLATMVLFTIFGMQNINPYVHMIYILNVVYFLSL